MRIYLLWYIRVFYIIKNFIQEEKHDFSRKSHNI